MTRAKKQSTEAAVREIRRKTRRKFAPEEKVRIVLEGLRGEQSDLPVLTGPGLELVYAASWFMGNSFPGTMVSGAGGRYPSALCGRMVL